MSDVFYTHSTHTDMQLHSQKLYIHTLTLSTLHHYSNGHTMKYHQDPHHYCVCVCVFVLGVSRFSHAKSCKPENTDHKRPTSMSNQQPPEKKPKSIHTHTHHATDNLYTQACARTLIINCTHMKKPCFQTHTRQSHWKHTATEHTTQPDPPDSLNKCLMLSLWYLPLHHCHFISLPHFFESASIVILARCWKYSSHKVIVIGWKQSSSATIPLRRMAYISVSLQNENKEEEPSKQSNSQCFI